ncbi:MULTISPECIES: TolC family outer membrane protein [Dyella]|uniref:Type I secretion protein TolC n=2 Tax=Dyella TaxID=231454 RepID=A0A4R0YGD8_9GAMM|nr:MULTISPECIES: TolC family outer membrane protein [Dyella]TBR36327.1 type I secretion protein TolC [Dyella terrae]TCI05984.1 type I secretion protein TolC [Dyella soli]
MRLKLLTLALALTTFPLVGHSEDLLDAYREARANDPVLSQSDAQRLATGEGVNQARALLLPQVNGTYGISQTTGGRSVNTDPVTGIVTIGSDKLGHSRTRNLSGTLTQSVIDMSLWAGLKTAQSQRSAQDEQYEAALQALYVRVTTAYFGVLTAQDQLTFAQANEEAYKQAYEQSDQRFKVGLSAVTDVYQAKSYYELAKAQTISAQNTLNDSREALTQITGKPTGELKKLREELPMDAPTPADPNQWVEQALKNNPLVLSQQYSVDAAEHSVNQARSGHLPTIDASVNYGKSGTWYKNGTPAAIAAQNEVSGGTTVGLTLRVPIFAGGATQSRVRQSIYERDAAQDSLESQRRQVSRDTLNFYRSVGAGILQVQANKASVDSGQKALEATRAGFDVGTQTMLNVLNAIQTLTQAESSYSQARHQFILNKLQLKQAAGTIDLKDLEGVNTLLQ